MLPRTLRVLLVEDSPADALLVEAALEEMVALTPELSHCESLAEAEDALHEREFDIVLVDLNLPDGQGLGNFERLQPLAPQTPMIVLTGMDDEELATQAIARGAADYLIKGATNASLLERSARYAIERKKNENDRLEMARLQIARDEAEANNRAKDEFLATLSHELRTPLNAIMGWASLLKTGQLDEETSRQALDTIERNSRVQAQLIEDLLDVSRIIAGNFKLELTNLDLCAVVRAAADTLRPSITLKNIQLSLDLPPVPLVRGDAMRLQQVAWNLLSNAIKFTPENGRVTVSVSQDPVTDSVVLRVNDSGQGIAAEFLPHVFERFRQADGSTTRRHGGLGLGLAIVRNVVALHGGQVLAESAGNGQGATFSVFLPNAVLKDPAAAALSACHPDAPPWTGVVILAVDDQDEARDFVRVLFEKRGAHVETAASARQALQLIRRMPPHLMISDIGMPDMDGYGLLEAVRAAGYTFPAIALTGFASRQAEEAGFERCLAKPIDPDVLCHAAALLLHFEA